MGLYGTAVEISRARIVAKPGPGLQDLVFARRSQVTQGGPSFREALKIVNNGVDTGLLKHKLGQHDLVGVGESRHGKLRRSARYHSSNVFTRSSLCALTMPPICDADISTLRRRRGIP